MSDRSPRDAAKGEARLRREAAEAADRCRILSGYLRGKIDQLLVMMGSRPLKGDTIDDRTLVALDPIGTISDSFAQVLNHMHVVNSRLTSEIAEHRRTGEILREKEERFRTLAEFSSDWVFWRAPGGTLLYVSPACQQISGYTPGEFYAAPDLMGDIMHPEDRDRWANHCHTADAQGLPGPLEFRIVTKEGTVRWISHVCRPVYAEDGQFLGVRGSQTNINEKKRTEEALRESEQNVRDFLDNAIDLVQSLSPDGRILYTNRAWRETLGYRPEEISRITIYDVVAPDARDHCREVMRRVFAGEDVGRIETRFVTRDGRQVVVEGHVNCRMDRGVPVSTRSIFRDITMKRKIEEEFRKASILESIGTLAGGIAHDFNNIMTAILGNISLAKAAGDDPVTLRRRLDEAEKASLRAKTLTGQLLTFAEGGAPIRQRAPVTDLIRETALFSLLGSNVRCEFAFAGDLWPVEIDEGQIGQVISNIVMNADQAMPDGGILMVRAENVPVTAADAIPLKEGPYVRISFEDQGIGISRKNLPKIFDPFFSTGWKGKGLGLPASYSIVRRHDGYIGVVSEEGRGSTFSVYLPASRGEGRARKTEAETSPDGRGRVLVMDDEDILRDVAVDILRTIGYEAAAVRDGSEALEAYRGAMSAGRPYDVVIMDLTVPGGMGGREAVRKLLEMDPGARVIVSSGYSNDPVMADYRKHGFVDVIAKPYRMRDLGAVLQRVFEG